MSESSFLSMDCQGFLGMEKSLHRFSDQSDTWHCSLSLTSNSSDYSVSPEDTEPDFPSDRSFSQLSLQCSDSLPEKFKLLGILTTPACLTTLESHIGIVSCVVVTPEFLYSASHGNDIRIWRRHDLVEYSLFGCGEGAVKAMLIVGDKIFTAHQDHKIRSWRPSLSQPKTFRQLVTLPTTKDYLVNCVLKKNYVQVRRHHKRLWIHHNDAISVLAVGKDKLLYSGSWDKTFKVWKLSDSTCIESVNAHDDAVNALVVAPEGYVYTGSADSKIKVWLKKDGEKKHRLISTLQGHKSAVNALALSADGSSLCSGGSDSCITVWIRAKSANHMDSFAVLRGHRQAVLCLCSTGSLLFSGSGDKTVRVWETGVTGKTRNCLAVLEGHKGPVKSIGVCEDGVAGFLVYTGSVDRSIKVWLVSRGSQEEASSDNMRTSFAGDLSI